MFKLAFVAAILTCLDLANAGVVRRFMNAHGATTSKHQSNTDCVREVNGILLTVRAPLTSLAQQNAFARALNTGAREMAGLVTQFDRVLSKVERLLVNRVYFEESHSNLQTTINQLSERRQNPLISIETALNRVNTIYQTVIQLIERDGNSHDADFANGFTAFVTGAERIANSLRAAHPIAAGSSSSRGSS